MDTKAIPKTETKTSETSSCCDGKPKTAAKLEQGDRKSREKPKSESSCCCK